MAEGEIELVASAALAEDAVADVGVGVSVAAVGSGVWWWPGLECVPDELDGGIPPGELGHPPARMLRISRSIYTRPLAWTHVPWLFMLTLVLPLGYVWGKPRPVRQPREVSCSVLPSSKRWSRSSDIRHIQPHSWIASDLRHSWPGNLRKQISVCGPWRRQAERRRATDPLWPVSHPTAWAFAHSRELQESAGRNGPRSARQKAVIEYAGAAS